MDDFVKPQNEKISQNPKVSFRPTEKRYIMLTDEDGNIKGCFPLKKKISRKGMDRFVSKSRRLVGATTAHWRAI